MRRAYLIAVLLLSCAVPATACTIATIADDDGVVFASNEDGSNAEARIWVVAPTAESRGAVYFGFDDGFRQGGMNDAGLCYDITACPRMALESRDDRRDPEANVLQMAMDRCATVDEVLELLAGYNLRGFERVQVLFADRDGRSAVIDANHVTRGADGRQVATNFYLAAPELGRHPCTRHEIASGLLPGLPATVDAARRLLSAVRQEGRSQTQYSFVAEPRQGRITVYRFHDFEQPAVLDLAGLLAGGDRELVLADLFPVRNHAAEAWQARQSRRLSRIFAATLERDGLDAAVAEYQATKIEHAEILNELAALGFEMQGAGRGEAAAAAFRLMTEDYPTFARGFEWLGNALVRLEDYEGARGAYERCLELDPGNAGAKDVLGQLAGDG